MRLFRLGVWKLRGTARVEFDIWISPLSVHGIERYEGVTTIHCIQGSYFTTILPEVILRGLSDISRLNSSIINFN